MDHLNPSLNTGSSLWNKLKIKNQDRNQNNKQNYN